MPSASSAFVSSAIRVHRIPPRVRDDREPPLQWDETAKHMQLIWVERESEYFCKGDWTYPPNQQAQFMRIFLNASRSKNATFGRIDPTRALVRLRIAKW